MASQFEDEVQHYRIKPDIVPDRLVVDIDGFEGPLDLLLELARKQKVDLSKISILQLVDQYTDFLNSTKGVRIRLVADYLVMASWLVLLKSRLLLPPDQTDRDAGEELASILSHRLRRLGAMREAAAKLQQKRQLGIDFFARGQPEKLLVLQNYELTVSMFNILQAYVRARARSRDTSLRLRRPPVLAVEEAIEKLRCIVGGAVNWSDLAVFLPKEWLQDENRARSATASTLVASLELAKRGDIELRQVTPGSPVQLRAKRGQE